MPKPISVSSSSVSIPNQSPFPYADYVSTRTALGQALLGPHFYALITGKSGMGKTSLLREVTKALDHTHLLVYFSSSKISLTGIVRVFAVHLHISPHRSFLETVRAITETIKARACHLVLVLDEADQIHPAILAELRLFAESDFPDAQIFSLILCGLPPLAEALDDPLLFPLKRRITARFTLTGLRRDELDLFLTHRFGTQDARRIPAGIMDELFERTQAAPALVHQVVQSALAASAAGTGDLDADKIRSLLDTLGG
jgi:type II secretory pathway predicted ATPase ExeA